MTWKAVRVELRLADEPWPCEGCGQWTKEKVFVIKHEDWPDLFYNDCPGWYICCDTCAAIVAERRMAIIRKAREKGAAHDTKGS